MGDHPIIPQPQLALHFNNAQVKSCFSIKEAPGYIYAGSEMNPHTLLYTLHTLEYWEFPAWIRPIESENDPLPTHREEV